MRDNIPPRYVVLKGNGDKVTASQLNHCDERGRETPPSDQIAKCFSRVVFSQGQAIHSGSHKQTAVGFRNECKCLGKMRGKKEAV